MDEIEVWLAVAIVCMIGTLVASIRLWLQMKNPAEAGLEVRQVLRELRFP